MSTLLHMQYSLSMNLRSLHFQYKLYSIKLISSQSDTLDMHDKNIEREMTFLSFWLLSEMSYIGGKGPWIQTSFSSLFILL